MDLDWKLLGLVGLGSGLGGVARYLLGGWLTQGDFPWGTMAVNVLGCFAIGMFLFGGQAGGWLTGPAGVFVAIGLLGGFTTMSTFTYETVSYVQEGSWRSAGLYLTLTLFLCFAGTLLGRLVGLAVWKGA